MLIWVLCSPIIEFSNRTWTVGIVQKSLKIRLESSQCLQVGEIIEIHEKPIYKEFVSAGIYCLEKSDLNQSRKQSMDMPDLIRILIDNRKKVTAFSIFETWDDVGFPSEIERLRLLFQISRFSWQQKLPTGNHVFFGLSDDLP